MASFWMKHCPSMATTATRLRLADSRPAGSKPFTATFKQKVTFAFVLHRTDYCNSILLGLLDTQLNRFQSYLNDSTHLTFGCHWNNHVSLSSKTNFTGSVSLNASPSRKVCSPPKPCMTPSALKTSHSSPDLSQMIVIPNSTSAITFKYRIISDIV